MAFKPKKLYVDTVHCKSSSYFLKESESIGMNKSSEIYLFSDSLFCFTVLVELYQHCLWASQRVDKACLYLAGFAFIFPHGFSCGYSCLLHSRKKFILALENSCFPQNPVFEFQIRMSKHDDMTHDMSCIMLSGTVYQLVPSQTSRLVLLCRNWLYLLIAKGSSCSELYVVLEGNVNSLLVEIYKGSVQFGLFILIMLFH